MSSNSSELKLHIGCGKRYIPGWIHVDQVKYDHVDYISPAHDLTMFEDRSCGIIYASHVLEYYDYEQARAKVLPEWYRVLHWGGVLRLSVPDFETISRLYQAGFQLGWFIGPLFGRMEVNGKLIYHKCVYDKIVLKNVLREVGFGQFRDYDWKKTEHAQVDDCSKGYIPHMRDDGIILSLNIEVTK